METNETVKSKKTHESKGARYIVHMIGVLAKCCMRDYDPYSIGDVKASPYMEIGKYRIQVRWGSYFSSYLKEPKELK